jgi:DNA polymerase V
MDQNPTNLAGGDGVSVHAGFPNPAIDRREQDGSLILDINKLLIQHPSSTYLFRISGHHWTDQGIFDGDVAVVDRAITPQNTDMVIDWHDGFSVERHSQRTDSQPAWGVITAIIHQYERD